MKNRTRYAALALALLLCLSLAACGEAAPEGLWADASYTEDTELGEGSMTITLAVTAEEKTVNFTIHTDAGYLRGALEENGLVAGEESEFGLYVKTVNGMTADYDADGAWWALYIGEELAPTGVDSTPVTDGAGYSFVCEAA